MLALLASLALAAPASPCPALLPTGRDPLSPAIRTALHDSGAPAERDPLVREAHLGFPGDRGMRRECRDRTARRTVVVDIHLRYFDHPPHASASLSEVILAVGRTRRGWRVIDRIH